VKSLKENDQKKSTLIKKLKNENDLFRQKINSLEENLKSKFENAVFLRNISFDN
jgi:hypothetical protein